MARLPSCGGGGGRLVLFTATALLLGLFPCWAAGARVAVKAASSVCFGAASGVGTFAVPLTGLVTAVRVEYVSGGVTCASPVSAHPLSHWGCDGNGTPARLYFAVVKPNYYHSQLTYYSLMWPNTGTVGGTLDLINSYLLAGYWMNSTNVTFNGPSVGVTVNQSLVLGYLEVLRNMGTEDNAGYTCADVYLIYDMVACSTPTAPDGADAPRCPGGILTPGKTCTFPCKKGFTGGGTMTCSTSESWTANGTCIPVTCSAPTAPAHAHAPSCPTGNLTAGKTCTFACKNGFTGGGTLTCSNSGKWKANGDCTPVTCSTLPAPENADTLCCPAGLLTSGNTCTFACKAGFTGGGTLSCNKSGTWTMNGSCTLVTCSRPTTPDGADTLCCPAGILTVGKTCTFTCKELFTGSGTMTCSTSGTWTASGTCTPVTCSAPTAPANSGPPSCPPGTLTPGRSCNFTCNPAFDFGGVGGGTLTCSSKGTWTANGICTLSTGVVPIFVGSSIGSSNKVVQLPVRGMSCTTQCGAACRLNKDRPNATLTFELGVMDQQLVVQRIDDLNSGWGMDLIVPCRNGGGLATFYLCANPTITAPASGTLTHNGDIFNCFTVFTAPPGKRVAILFDHLCIVTMVGRVDFLKIYDGGTEGTPAVIHTGCPTRPAGFVSTSNQLSLRFRKETSTFLQPAEFVLTWTFF